MVRQETQVNRAFQFLRGCYIAFRGAEVAKIMVTFQFLRGCYNIIRDRGLPDKEKLSIPSGMLLRLTERGAEIAKMPFNSFGDATNQWPGGFGPLSRGFQFLRGCY